jgi:hypothetical protein
LGHMPCGTAASAHLPVFSSAEELHGGLNTNGDGHSRQEQQLQQISSAQTRTLHSKGWIHSAELQHQLVC